MKKQAIAKIEPIVFNKIIEDYVEMWGDYDFHNHTLILNGDSEDSAVATKFLYELKRSQRLSDAIVSNLIMVEEGKGSISKKMRRRKAQAKKKYKARELYKMKDEDREEILSDLDSVVLVTNNDNINDIVDKEVEEVLNVQ